MTSIICRHVSLLSLVCMCVHVCAHIYPSQWLLLIADLSLVIKDQHLQLNTQWIFMENLLVVGFVEGGAL